MASGAILAFKKQYVAYVEPSSTADHHGTRCKRLYRCVLLTREASTRQGRNWIWRHPSTPSLSPNQVVPRALAKLSLECAELAVHVQQGV